MSRNLAAILPSLGSPLSVHPVELYTPGPYELLIKNTTIAFNAIEYKIAKLGAIPIDYPIILGSTFAGTIEDIGSQVTDYQVGARVVVSKRFGVKGNQYGAYQQYVVVADKMISRVPDGVDESVPASLMMNLTCVVGLFTGRLRLDRPRLDGLKSAGKNKKVLVYGGSSSFGGLSVQYLSQAGYTVVTTSSPRNRNFVDKLGAIVVIDHTIKPEALVDQLVAESPYDIMVDTISLPNTIAVTARVLAAQGGGKLYAMQPAFEPESLPEGVTRVFEPWSESLYEEKNHDLQEWVMQMYLPQCIAQGAIIPLPIDKVAGGLKGINEVLDRLQKGVSGVRLVADPRE
ncbi:GroES-like protein [Clathrospora elynae]|uniref:GroES-like protein n=1 Tax=Clathrospora elynae TaxID=706981 RepID=A0A6A5SD90_9PLEO|nr:GroES-like protein [Clathrospora elynae]